MELATGGNSIMEEKPKGKKKPGNKKGRKPTPQEIEAGKANLAKWLKDHPYPALRHGGFSKAVRERWSSLRTREGKELRRILDSFVADAGGPERLNQGQQTMLGIFKVCYIVTKQIGAFIEQQENGVFDKNGDLLPALHRVCTFTGAMQRAVESFYELAGRTAGTRQIPGEGLPPEIQSRLDDIFQKALPAPKSLDEQIEEVTQSLKRDDGLNDGEIQALLREAGLETEGAGQGG
jgi:hypothetical protein